MEVLSAARMHNPYRPNTAGLIFRIDRSTMRAAANGIIGMAHHIDFYTKKHYIKSRIWRQGEGIISLIA